MQTLEQKLSELVGELAFLNSDIVGMRLNGQQKPQTHGFGFEENAAHAVYQYSKVEDIALAALSAVRNMKSLL
jgi:hypothetical protein